MQPKLLLTILTAALSFFAVSAQNATAYKSIGKTGKILTLSKGKFDEQFDADSIQQVGNALINIHALKIVRLLNRIGAETKADYASNSRFLSVDPLQIKYPFSSPYSYVLDNPIINIDVDGREVLWFQPLTTSTAFKAVIKNLNKNDVFLTVVKRFKENQDNLFYKAATGSRYYGITPSRGMAEDNRTPTGANGYTVYISTSNLVSNNGDLLVDPTFAAKVIIHESMHAKFHLIQDENEINNSPTLNRNMQQQQKVGPLKFEGEHETMAEGDIQRLIDGMKGFDASNNTKHSAEWYESMAWRGSLMYNNGGSNEYKQLDPAKRKRLEQIADNEGAYEGYLKAKSTYRTAKTAANKANVTAAYNKVDWKLYKKTRN